MITSTQVMYDRSEAIVGSFSNFDDVERTEQFVFEQWSSVLTARSTNLNALAHVSVVKQKHCRHAGLSAA